MLTLPVGSRSPNVTLRGTFIQGPQDIPLYVESHGDPASRIKLMLVHGGIQSSLCYRLQVEALTRSGCFVVLYDLPWHGFSGPGPEQHALSPTPEIWGESLAAVRAHFGLQEEPIVLLGWSFGAIIVRNYLLQNHPRNIAGLVFVAALLDLEAYLPLVMSESPQAVELVQRLATPTTPVAERHRALQGFVDLLWNRPPDMETYSQVLGYNCQSFILGEGVLDTIMYGSQALGDLQIQLRGLNCPIMFMQGQDDRLVPSSYSRQLAAMLPGSTLVEFAGCGHSPFMELPEQFNHFLLEFVTGKAQQGIVQVG